MFWNSGRTCPLRILPARLAIEVVVVMACGGIPSGLAGQATVPSLNSEPISVRSGGLNGAGAALVGDAGAVFSNPAGLATLSHIGVEGAYRGLPAAGNTVYGALAFRVRQFDLAVAGAYLDHGTDPANFPISGLPPGTQSSERLAMGSLVYRFGIIALGGTLKYVRTSTGSDEQRAISSDAGLAIAIFDILALGFSIQNVGGNWRSESPLEMPRLSRFGFTMNYVDPQESFRLLSTLELQWPEGRSSRFVLGVEGGVVVEGVGIICRTAYGSRPERTQASRFTVGGTVAITRLSLDYAYQPNDVRGDRVHRFGLRLTL